MMRFGSLVFGLLLVLDDITVAAYFMPVRIVSRLLPVCCTTSPDTRSTEVEVLPSSLITEKKRKNLLSEEILRDSTIIISRTGIAAVLDKEKMKRRPNVSYLLIRRTLLHYKMRYGDMLVPTTFVIPGKSNDWPEEMWGLHLGKIVQSIRAGRRGDKRDDLISIGFCYSITSRRFEIIKQTLQTYKRLNNNLFIPRHFIVPNTSEWEEHSWGMKLGDLASNIRTGSSCYLDKREELVQMGFPFNVVQERFELLKSALLCYRRNSQHGDFNVTRDFVIPQTSAWPETMWGMKLGVEVSKIHSSEFKRKKELQEIGLKFPIKKKIDFETLKSCLQIYKSHTGRKSVPGKWKVPEESDVYPEKMWGACVGSLVGRIRRGEKWVEKREELLQLIAQPLGQDKNDINNEDIHASENLSHRHIKN
jgi:hypothetical protein